MCNLFRAVCTSKKTLSTKIVKEAGQFFWMSEVTDIPLLIRKYCIIKKEEGKSQTGHWADSVEAFLVSSVTRETLTYDVT